MLEETHQIGFNDPRQFAAGDSHTNTVVTMGSAQFNNSGSDNTASGAIALLHNIMGSNNTATGVATLLQNTTGFYNTATGVSALYANTGGHDNTA
jgi:hypothetical protein